MNKHISYTTFGTCSKQIEIEIVDDILTDVRFVGGCPGNTLGVSTLVKGMKIGDVVTRLEGIRCGFKKTSCPDQLARALKQAIESEASHKEHEQTITAERDN